MTQTKKLLNEVLVKIFNTILFNEEKQLHKLNSNLTMSEFHVLEAIKACDVMGDNTLGAISNRLNITAGTLTSSISRLEAKGYVKRTRNSVDRRKVFVFLTSSGEQMNELHNDFHNKMIDKVTENLSIKDEKLLTELLSKITEIFKKS